MKNKQLVKILIKIYYKDNLKTTTKIIKRI